jgi:transcription antitermination factor NusG
MDVRSHKNHICLIDRFSSIIAKRRGEALVRKNTLAKDKSYGNVSRVEDLSDSNTVQAGWHVLWTHSNCERIVYDQLLEQRFDVFLPTVGQWSRRRGLRYVSRVPMFPGYLFLHHAVDKSGYIKVCKAKGVVRILGERWDRLAEVPAPEIEAIQKLFKSDLAAAPHPYLRAGQRVRVVKGSLANSEGILLKSNPKKGLLILSVDLLHRSVSIEIDCTMVEPV